MLSSPFSVFLLVFARLTLAINGVELLLDTVLDSLLDEGIDLLGGGLLVLLGFTRPSLVAMRLLASIHHGTLGSGVSAMAMDLAILLTCSGATFRL